MFYLTAKLTPLFQHNVVDVNPMVLKFSDVYNCSNYQHSMKGKENGENKYVESEDYSDFETEN